MVGDRVQATAKLKAILGQEMCRVGRRRKGVRTLEEMRLGVNANKYK